MIVRNIKPILLATGLGTLGAGVLFFFPSLLSVVLHADVSGDAAMLFVRHWGLEVGCVGALLLYAAYQAQVRTAVLLSASVSKAGMVYLLLAQWGNPALAGFVPIIPFDTLCVVLYLVYLTQSRVATAQ